MKWASLRQKVAHIEPQIELKVPASQKIPGRQFFLDQVPHHYPFMKIQPLFSSPIYLLCHADSYSFCCLFGSNIYHWGISSFLPFFDHFESQNLPEYVLLYCSLSIIDVLYAQLIWSHGRSISLSSLFLPQDLLPNSHLKCLQAFGFLFPFFQPNKFIFPLVLCQGVQGWVETYLLQNWRIPSAHYLIAHCLIDQWIPFFIEALLQVEFLV